MRLLFVILCLSIVCSMFGLDVHLFSGENSGETRLLPWSAENCFEFHVNTFQHPRLCVFRDKTPCIPLNRFLMVWLHHTRNKNLSACLGICGQELRNVWIVLYLPVFFFFLSRYSTRYMKSIEVCLILKYLLFSSWFWICYKTATKMAKLQYQTSWGQAGKSCKSWQWKRV